MPDNEQLLVEIVRSAIAANDSNTAISALFEAFGERLLKMIALRLDHRLAGRIDPSDVLQDAFIDVIKKLTQYDQVRQVPLFIWIRTDSPGKDSCRLSQASEHRKTGRSAGTGFCACPKPQRKRLVAGSGAVKQ